MTNSIWFLCKSPRVLRWHSHLICLVIWNRSPPLSLEQLARLLWFRVSRQGEAAVGLAAGESSWVSIHRLAGSGQWFLLHVDLTLGLAQCSYGVDFLGKVRETRAEADMSLIPSLRSHTLRLLPVLMVQRIFTESVWVELQKAMHTRHEAHEKKPVVIEEQVWGMTQ